MPGSILPEYNAAQLPLTIRKYPLDTNHLERALRVIPMGKKNWNFCWTPTSDPPPPRILSNSQITRILRKLWRGLRDLVQALAQLPGCPLLVSNHGIQQQ